MEIFIFVQKTSLLAEDLQNQNTPIKQHSLFNYYERENSQ